MPVKMKIFTQLLIPADMLNLGSESILPFYDLFLYDLKIADEQHTQYTGVVTVDFKQLKIISKNNKPIIIRIPLIPDITDNIANLGIRNIIESTPE